MTFDELDKVFERAIERSRTDYSTTMVKIGNDALAMIKMRVQEKGEDAEGRKFKAYSEKDLLVGCKSMNRSVCSSFFGKKKNRDHEWVTIKRGSKNYSLAVLEGGYKKLREMHGRQTTHVDFTFSGAMWGGISIISSASEHSSGVVKIGGLIDEVKEVLRGNVSKRGPILELNRDELKTLTEIYKNKVKQFFI